MSHTLVRTVLASAAAAAALAQYYELDTTWPQLPPSLNLSSITAVTVANASDGSMEIHVAQRGTAAPPLLAIDKTGNLLRTYGTGVVTTPHGMQAQKGTPSTIWVTDVGTFTVKRLAINGTLLQMAGTPGVAGGGVDPVQFSVPADIAITPIGNIAVSDGDGGSNNRVVDLHSGSLTVFYGIGGAGSGPGQFSSPHSIAFEPAFERFWVADRGNARLQVFLGGSGMFVGEITDCIAPGIPWGVRIDAARNRVVVADGTNGFLYVLNVTWGANENELGACSMLQNITVGVPAVKPHELDIDEATGDIYLAGVGVPPTLQRYSCLA